MESTVRQENAAFPKNRMKKRKTAASKPQNSEKVRRMFRRYRHVIALIAILLATFFIGYYFDVFVIQGTSQSPACIIQSQPAYSVIPDLKKGDTISQQFEADGRDITGFALDFGTYQRANPGTLYFTLTDVETGTVLFEQRMASNGLADNQFHQIIFENAPVSCEKGQKLSINVYVEDLAPDATLTLYRTERDGYYQGVHIRNDRIEEDFDLAFQVYSGQNAYLRVVYYLFIVGCALFFMFVYVFVFVWRGKPKRELIAVLVIFFFGAAYSLLLPPNAVPDEPNHFTTAYHYSNVLLGTDQYDNYDEGYVGMRAGDVSFIGLNAKPDISVYSTIKDHLLETCPIEDMVQSSANIIPAPQFLYTFSTLGITLGRVLHLGLVPTYYLGRFFNLFAYCIAVYFAMKLMPFGKMTMFGISMLPIALQQVGSVSYDVMINALAFLLIGAVFYLAYGERKKPIRFIEMILVCILGILLTMCKTGAYALIFLLVFIIPWKRFSSKKTAYWFKGSAVIGIVVGFLIYSLISSICFVQANPSIYLKWTETPTLAYTVGDLLSDPVHTIQLFVRTLAYQKDFYTETVTGHLSWFTIKMSPFLMIVFGVWILLTGIRPLKEEQKMTAGVKWWVALLALGCFGIVLLGMAIGWTPNTYEIIQGVQGRYFLPFLPLLLLLVRGSWLNLSKNADGVIIFSGLWIQLLTILDYARIILQGVYVP
ncbi:MAG: DUF2142 domain-containing protein [Massiliimalia sp.]